MRHFLLWPLLLPLLAAAPPAGASVASLDDGPGASLVFPYVEVDLDQADGRNTTFSIGNLSDETVIAHAVLWSDWGVPVYAWDLHLPPRAMQGYNLRDLVVHGALPVTGTNLYLVNHCARPIVTPPLGPEALAELQRQLTGRPDGGGNCSSEPRTGRLATGAITVDVVRDCSHGGMDDPRDAGYFWANPPSQALAASREALWGDLYLIDPAESSAEGYEAVALGIERDASRASFWDNEITTLRREAPGTCSRVRFLRGGPFVARSTVLFFAQRLGRLGNLAPCAAAPPERHYYDAYSEAGERSLAGQELPLGRRIAARLEVGSEIPTELGAGFLQIYSDGDAATPILLAGTIEARGRFAVGSKGLAVETACRRPESSQGAQP